MRSRASKVHVPRRIRDGGCRWRTPDFLCGPGHQVRTSGDLQIAYQVVGDGPVDVALAFDWGSNIELVWEHPQTERFLRRFASYGRLIFFDAFLTCAGFQDDASFLAAARLRIRRWVGIPGRRAASRGEAGVGGGRPDHQVLGHTPRGEGLLQGRMGGMVAALGVACGDGGFLVRQRSRWKSCRGRAAPARWLAVRQGGQ